MSQSLDPSSPAPSDAARSRANTGNSLSPAAYGTSNLSAAGSSVVSHGSLLDLYARSPGSFPESIDAIHLAAASPTAAPGSSSLGQDLNTPPPQPSPTRGFQAPGRDLTALATGLPPSDSNASIWTTASASPTGVLPQSKRASIAGLDVDAMRSIQPAHDTHTSSVAPSESRPATGTPAGAALQDSDGSDYGDEEMPGAFSNSSFDRSGDRTLQSPSHRSNRAVEEVFSNALPSPPVPKRTSSVPRETSNISPSSSHAETFARIDSPSIHHASSRSNSGQFVMEQSSQARRIADLSLDSSQSRLTARRTQFSQDLAPSPVLSSHTVEQNPVVNSDSAVLQAAATPTSSPPAHVKAASKSSTELSLAEQKRLESELLAEADDFRPRTLKEARERARLRKQQNDASSSPPVTPSTSAQPAAATVSPRKGAFLHVRDVAASTTAASADQQGSRSSIESRDRPLRNPKRVSNIDSTLAADHRSISDRSAPSDYSHDSGIEGAFSFDDQALPSGQLPTGDADDVQASNMEDLTDAVDSAMNDLSFGDETLSADDEFATPMPAPAQQDTRPRLPPTLSSSRSLASVTGGVVSPPLASPAKYAPPTPRSTAFPSHTSKQSPISTPLASPMHPRVLQPSAPSHIDIYGKTVPMPKAFASKSIVVDKRRLSSWDRARTYAQYTNELLHLQTGLSHWMEVVQRPAMRQQNNRNAQAKQSDDWLAQGTMRSMHVRNEGSYADSVRSDMTFPMRGDGAKAKEISMMPTMPESPVRTAVNLPYPGVAQQPPRSASIQSLTSNVALPTSSQDSLPAAVPASRSSGNRFFSNLGRKGSKRAQPPISPPISTSMVPSTSLSSVAAGVGGSRAYLANSRNGSTTSPGLARGSTTTLSSVETSSLDPSRAESPATARRLSGLGLGGGTGGEIVSSPLAPPSSGRLDTVQERRNSTTPSTTPLASATTATTGGLRAPLGPRAPGGARSPNTTTTSTPVTPITPITPGSGGFGLGPTFVSRLSGTIPSAATTRSPNPDTYSYPDYLGPRRPSDLSSTSSSSSANHDSSSRAHLRSSLSYGSVRDRIRRGSNGESVQDDASFQETLVKLADILPDADQPTLRYYLKKAKGNDLTAIGDYLHDQSLGKLPRF